MNEQEKHPTLEIVQIVSETSADLVWKEPRGLKYNFRLNIVFILFSNAKHEPLRNLLILKRVSYGNRW
mgnify:CR=1 FL=1